MTRIATLRPQHAPGFVRALCFLPLLCALAACQPAATPQEVATAFWQAAVAGDRARLAQEVRARDRARVKDGAALLPVMRFELGRVVIDRGEARIDTQVGLGGDTPMNLAVVTELVEEDGRWCVDYTATVRDIDGGGELAHLLDGLRGLGGRLGDEVDRSVDEIERALPRLRAELERLESDVRAKLPELRKRLEDLTRELPRSPPPAPPPPAGPPPPDTVKAT